MAVDPKRTPTTPSRSIRPQVPSAREFGLVKSLANLEHQLSEALSPSIIRQLLMNACDALPNGDRRGVIRLAISRNALYVANRGRPFQPAGLAEGGRLLGERPRQTGDGYARRGIGLSAVLSLCRRPEVYSGPRAGDRERMFDRQWRFDAVLTQRETVERHPGWVELPMEWREDLTGPDGFPVIWVPHDWDIPTAEIARELAHAVRMPDQETPLDTVIRLENGALEFEPWLARVRQLVVDETRDDAIWVLLDRLERVWIEDWESGTVEAISIERQGDRVSVRRDMTGQPPAVSHWRWIETTLPFGGDMSRRLAWVFRLDDQGLGARAMSGGLAAPMPLREQIALPFYAWAAWPTDLSGQRVDPEAAWRHIQDALLGLLRRFLAETAETGFWDSLVGHWEPISPQDAVMTPFYEGVLAAFREVAWVPADGVKQRLKPSQVLLSGAWGDWLKPALPAPLLWKALQLAYPLAGEKLCERLGAPVMDERLLERWLRSPQVMEAGLTAWNALMEWLRRRFPDRGELEEVVGRLRRDASIRLLPVVGQGVDWVPLPDEGHPSSMSPLVRYWPSFEGGESVAPGIPIRLLHPQCVWRPSAQGGHWLDEEHLAFLRHSLRVLPLTVEELLQWLPEAGGDEATSRALAKWLFSLMGAQVSGQFSLRRLLGRVVDLADPHDRTAAADTWRLNQQRLECLPLPGRDGKLHAAHELLMGHDWDDGSGDLRALESLYAPLRRPMLASPKVLSAWLPLETVYAQLTAGDAEMAGLQLGLPDPAMPLPPLAALHAEERERLHMALMRAFLVRAGVWAVPPIRPVADADVAWPHAQAKTVSDFALTDFEALVADQEGRSVLLRLLNRYWDQYANWRLDAHGVCRGCSQHRGARWLLQPSRFHRQLRENLWLPHLAGDLAGVGTGDAPIAWWRGDGSGPESPWRFFYRVQHNLHPLLEAALNVQSVGDLSLEETLEWLRRLQTRWRRGLGDAVAGDREAQAAWVQLHHMLYRHLDGFGGSEGGWDLPVLATAGGKLTFVRPEDARFVTGAESGTSLPVAELPSELADLARRWGIPQLAVVEKWLWPLGEPIDVTREVRTRLRAAHSPWAHAAFRALYGERFLKSQRLGDQDVQVEAGSGVQALGGEVLSLAIDIPPDQWGERLVSGVESCLQKQGRPAVRPDASPPPWRWRSPERDWLLTHERPLAGAMRLANNALATSQIRIAVRELGDSLLLPHLPQQVADWWSRNGQSELAAATLAGSGPLSQRYAAALGVADSVLAEAAQAVWGNDWGTRKQAAVARRLYEVAQLVAAIVDPVNCLAVWEAVMALGATAAALHNWREAVVRLVRNRWGDDAARRVFQVVRDLSLDGTGPEKLQAALRQGGLSQEDLERVVVRWCSQCQDETASWSRAIEEGEVPVSTEGLFVPGVAWRLPDGGGVRQARDVRSRDLVVALFLRQILSLGAAAAVETGEQLYQWLIQEFRWTEESHRRLAAHLTGLRAAERDLERIWHLGALMTGAGELVEHGLDVAGWNSESVTPVAAVVRPVRSHQDEVGVLARQWQLAQRLGERFVVVKVWVTATVPEQRFEILTNPCLWA